MRMFNINTVTFNKKYLALPRMVSRSKKATFKDIKERVRKEYMGGRKNY